MEDVISIALCLAASAFFSGSETALSSLPVTRLEALRERSGRLARAGLDRWADAPQEVLITILVGNNLVNVLASALATQLAYRFSEHAGLATVVGLMTLFILVFGEITPKSLAQQNAQKIAVAVAPVLFVLDILLRPITRTLAFITNLLPRSSKPDLPVTEEDLLFMLRLAHRHAQLPRDARHMIESVLRFQQTVAREVMVPRPRVTTVDVSWDLETLHTCIAASGSSRFPVVDGSPDHITGVLHAKHLLQLEDGRPWTEAVVDPLFIPEGRALPDLLQDFRRQGQHLAIVLDEFGGLSGVVTLEDAVELLVGEIEDEFDNGETVVKVEAGWLAPGYLSLRRLEAILHRAIENPEGIDSVGGLIASRLDEKAIHVGAEMSWDHLILEVAEVRDGRATRVLIKKPPAKDGA